MSIQIIFKMGITGTMIGFFCFFFYDVNNYLGFHVLSLYKPFVQNHSLSCSPGPDAVLVTVTTLVITKPSGIFHPDLLQMNSPHDFLFL